MTTTAQRQAEQTRLPSARGRRIPALDGLRGLAVVAVLLYHGGKLQGGFLGVDLFFVLSGFLITQVLCRNWSEERGIALGTFWWRRVQRLLPAMLLMLVVIVPLFALRYATASELTILRRDGFGTIFYVSNWEQIFFNQVYGADGLIAPLRHTWSLAIEEQIYLFWPLLALVLLRRGGVRLLYRGALALAVLSASVTVLIATTGWFSLNSLYLGTHSRFGAVMIGAAFAAWHGSHRQALRGSHRSLDLAAVVAVAIFTLLTFTLRVDQRFLYTGGFVISGLCGIVLVIAASQRTPGPAVRLLEITPLRWLGTVSYGIYLWSWPIMQIVSVRTTDFRGWTLFAVQVALTFAAASLSWYLLERPILSNVIPRRATVIIVTVGAVAAVLLVQLTTSDATPLVSDNRSTANYVGGGADVPKLLVLGDSVPARIAEEGIAPQAAELGVSVVDRSVPGCILLREVGEVTGFDHAIREDVTPCAKDWASNASELEPDLVLIMFGQFATDRVKLGGTDRTPCAPEYAAAQTALLGQAIDRVSAPGRQVFLATMPGTNVSWVLDRSPDLNEQMACLNATYRQVADARSDTTLIDFDRYICPDGQCRSTLDGVDLREDVVHFRFDSAKLVARWLVQAIVASPGYDGGIAAHDSCDALRQIADVATKRTSEGQDVLDIDGLRSLRDLDFSEQIANADPTLQPALEVLADNVDEIADRLDGISADAKPGEVIQRLGPLAPSVIEVATWAGENC